MISIVNIERECHDKNVFLEVEVTLRKFYSYLQYDKMNLNVCEDHKAKCDERGPPKRAEQIFRKPNCFIVIFDDLEVSCWKKSWKYCKDYITFKKEKYVLIEKREKRARSNLREKALL